MSSLNVELGESRYDRQERITWWDQDRLARSRVLVVGAGALGNEIVKNLVLIGVGSIVVVDFDTVELSNLARCVFFRPEDEGEVKASALSRRATELNAACEVVGIERDVRTLGSGIARRADVVVGALDSREARLYLNRLAWRAGKPWVDGAIEALQGVARVFTPPESCYECTLTERDYEILNHRQSCRLLGREDLVSGGKVPTTATTSSIIAGVQSQEVVKLLHADRDGVRPLQGATIFDGANNHAYILRYPFDENCAAHETFEDPEEIDGTDDTTFADVAATTDFDEAVIELGDDHLVSWQCTHCEVEEPASGLVSLLTIEHSRCPTCEEPRQPKTTTRVAVPGPDESRTLRSFGVRDDEVLTVRHGMEEHHVWIRRTDPDLPEGW